MPGPPRRSFVRWRRSPGRQVHAPLRTWRASADCGR